jgi:hypothetical protein
MMPSTACCSKSAIGPVAEPARDLEESLNAGGLQRLLQAGLYMTTN